MACGESERSMSLNFGFGILDSGFKIWAFELWEFGCGV